MQNKHAFIVTHFTMNSKESNFNANKLPLPQCKCDIICQGFQVFKYLFILLMGFEVCFQEKKNVYYYLEKFMIVNVVLWETLLKII